MRINIFDYATSELSQDAFICYLMCFGKKECFGSKEYDLAHIFLKKIGINEDINDIEKQDNNIDVLIKTNNYAIIIEDKIHSKENNKQIKRYYEDLISRGYKKKNIKIIYFKTGFTSNQEKRELEEKYNDLIILDIDEIKELIDTYDGNDQIINMWKEKVIENYNVIHSDINYFDKENKLKQDVYMDKIVPYLYTHLEDNNDSNKISWFKSNGRTSHIRLWENFYDFDTTYDRQLGIYIIFRKTPIMVLKQHLYKKEDHDNYIKLNTMENQDIIDYLINEKNKIQNKALDKSWKIVKENKLGLIILKKTIDINDIKSIKQDFDELMKFI